MRLRCAIFDFDGTLFDSMPIWETVGERYLLSMGKTPKATLREALRTMSMRQAARYLQAEYGLTLPEDAIIQGVNRIVEQFYFYEAQPKAGAEDFVRRLRQAGFSLCIATATDRYLVEAALRRCGMADAFREIFTCSQVGHGKDAPVIYRRAMECLGGDRSTTVVFEDALHALQTAKNDGFFTVAVYDASEKHQQTLRQCCGCYLPDYFQTEIFWKLVNNE